MKIVLLLLNILSVCLTTFSQQEIVIGKKFKIQSASLHESRDFWVYLPPDYNNHKYEPAKYPVVYLLDGETNFHSFTGIQQALSKGPYAMIPQMIVIGIVNTDRTRDLTPTRASRQAFYDKGKSLFQNSGGNSNFITFLEKELRPYIDSVYRTSGYNILNGHSFGGLTAVNILLNKPMLFNAYIIIDPSLWWDDQVMLKKTDSILGVRNFENRSIYLALANKEIVPQDTTTDHPRSIREFERLLSIKNTASLRWKFKFYENDDHGTVPIPAEFDGLQFIFTNHMVHVKQAIEDPSLVDKHYSKLSKQLGFKFKPTESYIDWLGNYCLGIDLTEMAIIFYQLNIDNHPASLNAYLAMQNAYEKNGNNAMAEIYKNKIARLKLSVTNPVE